MPSSSKQFRIYCRAAAIRAIMMMFCYVRLKKLRVRGMTFEIQSHPPDLSKKNDKL
jgi:hypothetical protein